MKKFMRRYVVKILRFALDESGPGGRNGIVDSAELEALVKGRVRAEGEGFGGCGRPAGSGSPTSALDLDLDLDLDLAMAQAQRKKPCLSAACSYSSSRACVRSGSASAIA
ncbi:hypothetical protein GCM10022284_22820 [Streptomyces hundungensis]